MKAKTYKIEKTNKDEKESLYLIFWKETDSTIHAIGVRCGSVHPIECLLKEAGYTKVKEKPHGS